MLLWFAFVLLALLFIFKDHELIVKLITHQQQLDSPNDVHGSSDAVTQVKEYSHGSSKLWPECTRHHEVGSALLHHTIRGHSAQRDGRHKRLYNANNTPYLLTYSQASTLTQHSTVETYINTPILFQALNACYIMYIFLLMRV
jgi:hypothetical protein